MLEFDKKKSKTWCL